MKRSRSVALVELALLLVSAALALRLPAAAFAWPDLLWFVAGLTILKLSDVWLPRGDTVGMSSALALGALLLFDVRVVLVMLLLAELLALVPKGRNRMWRAALGALTAEGMSAVVCAALLVPLGLHPATGLLIRMGHALRPEQYLFVVLVGLFFAGLEFGLLQIEIAVGSSLPIRAALLGSLSYGGWLIAAQASAGVLAALMYRTMGVWGLAVSVVMILVMRQSFVLLLEIRQAYNATIDVLIRAMEAQSPGREGVAERNAELCTAVGRETGLHGHELERLRYAALLLGVGNLETDAECDADASVLAGGPARIVEGVEFLSDVVPVLRLCDSPRETTRARRSDLACSYTVMAVGVATNTVGREQMLLVRERVSPRVVREIDRALSAVLDSDGARTATPGAA